MKAAMKENLSKRPFHLASYKIDAILHPETKQLRFLDESERKEASDLVTEEATALVSPQALQVQVKTEPEEEAPELPTPPVENPQPDLPTLPALPQLPEVPVPPAEMPSIEPPEKKHKVDDADYDPGFLDDIICMGEERSDPNEKIKQELERYMLEPPSKMPALEWWKSRVSTFPTLSRLAAKYLCIPASSVPSERIFSIAGNIVTKKRCRLSPDNVNQMIFLHRNRKGRVDEEEEWKNENKHSCK